MQINKLFKYILFLVMSCYLVASAFASQDIEKCPPTNFHPEDTQILVQGRANSIQDAKIQAITNLSNYVGGGEVESQYISRRSNYSAPKYESNSSVINKTIIDSAHFEQESLPCGKGGFINYILYDNRPLKIRIVDAIGRQNVHFFGPQYLVNSDLIKSFNRPVNTAGLAPLTLQVDLRYHPSGMQLLLGSKHVKVSPSELQSLLYLHSTNNPLLNLNTETNKISGIGEMPFSIESNKKESFYKLIVCQYSATCRVIGTELEPNTQYNLRQPVNANTKEAFILFAVPSNHSISQKIEQQTTPILIELLNALDTSNDNTEFEMVAAKQLLISGNF